MSDTKKILVIDDQKDNVLILRERLERVGYNIIFALDGKTGIEKAIDELPDLVLLDVMMPDMSGFEVCKTLNDNADTRDIPVILVTALTSPDNIKQGLQAGAYDYIKKPFNKVELLARIGSALKFSEAKQRLVELEKNITFAATVLTANHEIKQPLTLINLSSAAIKRLVENESSDMEAILKRVEIIEDATRTIQDIFEQLGSIKKPIIKDYVHDLKIIELKGDD